MKRVFNFSGGKTSGYMTIKYYKEGDIVIFCDTGREHPATYEFINTFEKVEKIPIIRLKYGLNPFQDLLMKKKNSILTNIMTRFCTSELKVKLAKRYLNSIRVFSYENFIGFRFDEPQRVLNRKSYYKKVVDKFPLFDDRVTKEFVNYFWTLKQYNLQIPSILGNCDLCFLKGKNSIIHIMSEYPELAEKWIKDEAENKSGKTFINGISYSAMLQISKNLIPFKYGLESQKRAYNCDCSF